MRQVQAPTYKYDGKIAAGDLGDRWFVDLIDFTAAPSGGGKKTLMRGTKDNEACVLVVQDVFSRFLWAEALVTRTPEEVAQAFEKILQRAGITPHSLTSDVGPEWTGEFARMLDSEGIVSFKKRPEDKNAIATLDVAIAQLKNSSHATH